MRLRDAGPSDVPAIAAVLNHAIQHTTARFETDPWSDERVAAWLAERGGPLHPVLVAEDEGGVVVGYAALSRYDEKCGYRGTVELSVYVEPGAQGRGVGRVLCEAVLRRGFDAGVHCVFSRVAAESDASLRLHEALGFERVGVFRESGVKFGRRLDVVFLQKLRPEESCDGSV